MTTTEARKLLKAAFPGKQAYICLTLWTNENGEDNPPRFSCCVYNVKGDGENYNGDGSSVEEAVRSTILKQIPADDVESVFAEAAELSEVVPTGLSL